MGRTEDRSVASGQVWSSAGHLLRQAGQVGQAARAAAGGRRWAGAREGTFLFLLLQSPVFYSRPRAAAAAAATATDYTATPVNIGVSSADRPFAQRPGRGLSALLEKFTIKVQS